MSPVTQQPSDPGDDSIAPAQAFCLKRLGFAIIRRNTVRSLVARDPLNKTGRERTMLVDKAVYSLLGDCVCIGVEAQALALLRRYESEDSPASDASDGSTSSTTR